MGKRKRVFVHTCAGEPVVDSLSGGRDLGAFGMAYIVARFCCLRNLHSTKLLEREGLDRTLTSAVK